MSAALLPVPAPPERCASGHDHNTDECAACEDLANWHADRNAWCATVEEDEDPTLPTEGAFQVIRDMLSGVRW